MPEFLASMACFVFAGLSGIWMRAAQAGLGLPEWVEFANLRHAHSHLMFFSWVTPALMVAVAALLGRGGESVRGMRTTIWANIVFGLLTFPPFLLWGYDSVAVGTADLPIAAIVSGFNIFAWYAFGVIYVRHRGRLIGDATRLCLDVAVATLVLCSVGAWGRAALVAMDVTDPLWTSGSVHFFLTPFSFGWLIFAALAVVHNRVNTPFGPNLRAATWSAAAALPLLFVLALDVDLPPPKLRSIAAVAGMAFALGVFYHAGAAWVAAGRGSRWRRPLLALMPVAVIQAFFALRPFARWADAAGLRVVYLHLTFLGFISVVLVEWLRDVRETRSDRRAADWFTVAVVALIVTMLPATGIWPTPLGGSVARIAVAVGASLPVLVMVGWLASARHR
jgi:heme/copper-type cytochrome/quinol oxidase subunit 4